MALRHWKFMGRRGIATIYSSLVFFFMVFALLLLIMNNFVMYNQSVISQHQVDDDRKKENITIANVNGTNPVTLVINNTGTIEVRIRAIYVENNQSRQFIEDPSIRQGDSYIAPAKSLVLNLTGISYTEETEIAVTTERGTISKQYVNLSQDELVAPPGYDSMQLSIGPVILVFDKFYYMETDNDGNPLGNWLPGWEPTFNKSQQYCAWKVTVMNNDTQLRNITIEQFSSFRLFPIDGSSNERGWYLQNQTQLLPYSVTRDMIFIWATPSGSTPQQFYSSSSNCMIFMTLLGHYSTGISYGQTIPFEATVTG